MCGDSNEACTVWDEKTVVGRKEHKCSECRQPILKGEKHIRIGMLYEGEWSSERLCMSCQTAWHEHVEHMDKVHKENCLIMIGGLAECKIYHDEDFCPTNQNGDA